MHLAVIDPNEIEVSTRPRALDPEKVKRLEASIEKIGLQHPITVREAGANVVLVAGLHRLEAVKRLKHDRIHAFLFQGDEREAKMWEIAENLHRAELTMLECSEQIPEWMRLAAEVQSAQVDRIKDKRDDGRGHQPETGISKAARELGVERKAAQRAAKIVSLADEAKATARDLGLDNNQSALLEAPKTVLTQRKRRKLSAPKDQQPPAEPIPAAKPAASGPAHEPANVNGGPAIAGAPDQSAAPTQGSLRDLSFEATLAIVKEWFAALPISQQDRVLLTLVGANDTSKAAHAPATFAAQAGNHGAKSQYSDQPPPPTQPKARSLTATRNTAR